MRACRGAAEAPTTPVGVSDEDEAFSFPVTPPSEPAAPGAVFSSWASFQSGGRAHKVAPLGHVFRVEDLGTLGAVFSSWASFQSGGRAHKVAPFACS